MIGAGLLDEATRQELAALVRDGQTTATLRIRFGFFFVQIVTMIWVIALVVGSA
jgi:hypothetical protein